MCDTSRLLKMNYARLISHVRDTQKYTLFLFNKAIKLRELLLEYIIDKIVLKNDYKNEIHISIYSY